MLWFIITKWRKQSIFISSKQPEKQSWPHEKDSARLFVAHSKKKFFWTVQVRKSNIATTFKEDVFGIFLLLPT